MKTEPNRSAPSLSEASPQLLEFARAFLAAFENGDESFPIDKLTQLARDAVARAERPWSELTAKRLEELKDNFLAWTGGVPPTDEYEIFAYAELCRPSDLDPGAVQLALRSWMIECGEDP